MHPPDPSTLTPNGVVGLRKDFCAALAAAGLPHDAVLQVRHARRLDRPHGFDLNVVGPEAREEGRPAAEGDRRDVELELVD